MEGERELLLGALKMLAAINETLLATYEEVEAISENLAPIAKFFLRVNGIMDSFGEDEKIALMIDMIANNLIARK